MSKQADSTANEQALAFNLPTGKLEYVWQLQTHLDAAFPTQAVIPGVEPSEHGTFESFPYYAFMVDATNPSIILLVSDLGLVAELTLIEGSVGERSNGNLGAKYQVKPRQPAAPGWDQFTNVVLSYNDDSLAKKTAGFVITGTSSDFEPLPSGSASFYSYSQVKPKETSSMTQNWGDIFVHKPFGLEILARSFNMLVMDIDNFQNPKTAEGASAYPLVNADKLALQFPDAGSKNYDSGTIPIPWGWNYTARSEGSGGNASRMVSSVKDVMNSVMRATGFSSNSGVSATGKMKALEVVDASQSDSLSKNRSVIEKIGTVLSEELTTTEHTAIESEYAMTVDKHNAHLDPTFRKQIEELATTYQKDGSLCDSDLDEFFNNMGTHYVYSATFGAKGSCTETFTKKQLQNLIENQVDLKRAWSDEKSFKLVGIGSHNTEENNKASSDENISKLLDAKSDAFTSYSCVGGGACNGGTPGSGEDRPPIFLDLRPISELMGPPFFVDALTAVNVRGLISKGIERYGLGGSEGHKPGPLAYEVHLAFPAFAFGNGGHKKAKLRTQIAFDVALAPKALGASSLPGRATRGGQSDPGALEWDIPADGLTLTIITPPKYYDTGAKPIKATYTIQVDTEEGIKSVSFVTELQIYGEGSSNEGGIQKRFPIDLGQQTIRKNFLLNIELAVVDGVGMVNPKQHTQLNFVYWSNPVDLRKLLGGLR